jgi:hypothetical protein
MRTYVALFLMLYTAGLIFSKLADMTGFSFYTCNFVYGVIIAMYVMENWALLRDLKEMRAKSPDMVVREEDMRKNELENIMAALFVRIDVLTRENAQLRESHKREKIKRRLEIHSYSDPSLSAHTQSGRGSIVLKDRWTKKHRCASV